MNASKTLASTVAALAVAGSIGFAYAQSSNDAPANTTNSTLGQPVNQGAYNSDSATTTTPSSTTGMDSSSTTGSSTSNMDNSSSSTYGSGTSSSTYGSGTSSSTYGSDSSSSSFGNSTDSSMSTGSDLAPQADRG